MDNTDESSPPSRKRDALSLFLLEDESEDEDEDEDEDWEDSETIDAIDDTKTVFISGEYAASKRSDLELHGITHVLTVAEESEFKMKKAFKHKQIPVMDNDETPLIAYFEECFDFIDYALKDGKVLVHCVAGASRSATICIAYLMRKYKISFEEALTQLQKRRPVVDPNLGFVEQLKLFEKMKYTLEGETEYHKQYQSSYVIPNKKFIKKTKRSKLA